MFIDKVDGLTDLESDIIICKEVMMYLLIAGEKITEMERLLAINELLNVSLDEDDFGEEETSPSYYLMEDYNLLLSEGEYDKFIEAFKKQLLEREKYEFLHELDL